VQNADHGQKHAPSAAKILAKKRPDYRRISGSSKPIWSEDEQDIGNIEGYR
jgi:hypothetical protein